MKSSALRVEASAGSPIWRKMSSSAWQLASTEPARPSKYWPLRDAFSSAKAMMRKRSSHAIRSIAIWPTGLPKVLAPISAALERGYGVRPLITSSLAEAVLPVQMKAIRTGEVAAGRGGKKRDEVHAGFTRRDGAA